MADMPDPMTPASSMGQARQPISRSSRLDTPGLVTFAAMMMFLLGGFQIAWTFVEFLNAAWYGSFGGHPWLWAILDAVFALAALYAGFNILAGGRFGQVFGLLVAGLSAIRWFFVIPAVPWVAIVIIAIDVLIIYGLVSHAEYFGARSQGLP